MGHAPAIGFHCRRPVCCSARYISSPHDSLASKLPSLPFSALARRILRSRFAPDVSMSLAVDSAVSFLLFVGRCSSPRRRAASIVNRLLVLVISCMHPMEKGRRNHSCSGTRVAIIHPKTSRIRMQPVGTFSVSL